LNPAVTLKFDSVRPLPTLMTILFMLAASAMSAELFNIVALPGVWRLRVGRKGCSKDGDQGACGRDCCRLYNDLLPRTGRSPGKPGASEQSGSVLADLLFRYGEGPLKQMYFVVLLPDGTVVEPRVERRM
jgi:hypothetical protein